MVLTGGLCKGEEPVAHWSFEGLNESAQVVDQAGKAHAALIGEVEKNLFQPGLYGKAIHLPAGVRYLEVPPDVAPGLTEDFTVHVVIMPYQVHSYRTIFWKGDRSSEPNAINYWLGIRDGRLEFKYKSASGEWIVFTTSTIAKVQEWLDVVLYHSGQSVEMAVNGRAVPVTQTDILTDNLRPVENTHPLRMGVGANARGGQDFWFDGLLDELAIYQGRVLRDTAEINALYQEKLMDYEDRKAAFAADAAAATAAVRSEFEERYRKFFDEEAVGAPFVVRAKPASQRVEKGGDAASAMLEAASEVRLSAAGNEVESVQLLIAAGLERGLEGVKVIPSALRNEAGDLFPAENIEWAWVRSVTTERPGIPVQFAGEIPDVVMDGEGTFNVGAGDFTPVLLRFKVPAGTPAGVYQGKVAVVAGEVQQEMAVTLRVYGFSLPERGSLKVAFAFFEDLYCQWYEKTALSQEERLRIYRFLLDYRVPPSNIYNKEALYPDADSLKAIAHRTNFLTVRGWGGTVLDDAAVATRVAEYRAALETVGKLGLGDYVYFYGVDEIAGHLGRGLPIAKQTHEVFSTHLPGMRTIQTSFPIPEIRSLYNTWVPLVDHFGVSQELEILEGLRKDGGELWWYVADTPLHPYPNLFLDYPVFDSRIFGTLSWRYNVDGVLYWAINREWLTNMDIRKTWPASDWQPYIYHISTGIRKQRNGMGNLIYPGADGRLLPSLRLENLRDGLEDYEYYAELRRRVAKVKDEALRSQAETLLEIPSDVARAVNDYNPDPSALMRHREAVAAMIEKLQEVQP